MPKSYDPYPNRGPTEATSISTPLPFSPPMPWIHVESAGSGGLVVKSESGATKTYTNLPAGRVLRGPFSEITSMTLTRISYGDGNPPTSTLGTVAPGATGSLGAVKLSVAPADSGNPIAVGDNDPRLPGYWQTAATQTASWTVAIDTLYILNTTNTAAVATLPALAVGNDGHRVGMFNAGTTAGVWTPASGDCVGGTAASNATLAGPAAGVMKTLIANLATRRWIPLA